jgi:hypothetical protein
MAPPVIRAGVMACLLVLGGCTPRPVVREEWLRKVRARGDGICSWTDARWEDRGPLLVTGTALPLGRARSLWLDGAWAGALVSGTLRKSGPVLVFEGRWSRDGVTLTATVDAGEHPVFRAHEPMRVGEAGLALKGASLRLVEAAFGKVLAQPAAEALEPFAPVEPPLLEVACASLTLHGPAAEASLDGPRALALAGFPASAPARWLPERATLGAAAEPGGELVGRFVSKDAPVQGYLLAEAGAEARFAVPTPSGVLWVGWVPRDALHARPALAGDVPGHASPPSLDPGRAWRTCPDEELELYAARGEALVRVGSLARNTPFVLGRRAELGVEVDLAAPWLDLEPEVALLVGFGASTCPLAPGTGS